MWALPVLLMALTAPPQVPEEEAERVCRDMEKRLLEAKTVRLSFAMTLEVDTQEDKLQGTMWLGEGNKARIEVKGTMSGKPLEMLMISNGSQMIAKLSGTPPQGPRETPKGAGELIRGTVARAGIFAGLFYGVNERKEPTLDELFQLGDFKIGRREKRANGEIFVIEYKIGFRGAKDKGLITVQIDGQSHLPQKRVFTINDTAHKVRVIEVYEGFATEAKIEEELFELPK